MAGKTKRSGDWDKEGHIRVHLNIERQQFFQPTKEMTNARPRGLRIWYIIYEEIQTGSVATSYMRKGFLIYEEMRKYLAIYEKAIGPNGHI